MYTCNLCRSVPFFLSFFCPVYGKQPLYVKPKSDSSVSLEHFFIKAFHMHRNAVHVEISVACFHSQNAYICDLNAEIPIVPLKRIYLIHVLISLALTGFRVTLREINSCDIFLQRMCSVSELVQNHQGI